MIKQGEIPGVQLPVETDDFFVEQSGDGRSFYVPKLINVTHP